MNVLSTRMPFQSRSRPTASLPSTSFSRAESNQELDSVFLSGSQIGVAGRRASQRIFWVQKLLKIITYLHRLNRCPCESHDGIRMRVVSFAPRVKTYGTHLLGQEIFFSPGSPNRLRGPPSLCWMGGGSSFPGSETAGAWRWPLISV